MRAAWQSQAIFYSPLSLLKLIVVPTLSSTYPNKVPRDLKDFQSLLVRTTKNSNLKISKTTLFFRHEVRTKWWKNIPKLFFSERKLCTYRHPVAATSKVFQSLLAEMIARSTLKQNNPRNILKRKVRLALTRLINSIEKILNSVSYPASVASNLRDFQFLSVYILVDLTLKQHRMSVWEQ